MKALVFSVLIGLVSIAWGVDKPTGQMPEWMKYTKPADGHKALNDLAGKWNYTLKWWMAADAKAEESKGTSTTKWIMGGRYLQQEVKAKMQGENFTGMGITGFDTVRNEYQSTWIDSMSTHMMYSSGTKNPTENTIAQAGSLSCPMTMDKNRAFRTELKLVNKNEHTYTMFTTGQDGKEFKSMEISYRRAGKENLNTR